MVGTQYRVKPMEDWTPVAIFSSRWQDSQGDKSCYLPTPFLVLFLVANSSTPYLYVTLNETWRERWHPGSSWKRVSIVPDSWNLSCNSCKFVPYILTIITRVALTSPETQKTLILTQMLTPLTSLRRYTSQGVLQTRFHTSVILEAYANSDASRKVSVRIWIHYSTVIYSRNWYRKRRETPVLIILTRAQS